MANMKLRQIRKEIRELGWFSFGEKQFVCPGLGDDNINYYMRNQKLPPICASCYKPLIFWDDNFYDENVANFLNMVNSFEQTEVAGKFDETVVVFYFSDKPEMLNFIELLKQKMQEFSVKGRIQWRRACKEYQNILPHLWSNAKEFIPDVQQNRQN